MIQNTLVLLYIENGSLNIIMVSNYFTFAAASYTIILLQDNVQLWKQLQRDKIFLALCVIVY